MTLESVLRTFHEGRSAEEIVESFPSLALADVYATLAHYLRNRDELDAYLEATRAREDEVLEELERRRPPNSLRERLLARQRA